MAGNAALHVRCYLWQGNPNDNNNNNNNKTQPAVSSTQTRASPWRCGCDLVKGRLWVVVVVVVVYE